MSIYCITQVEPDIYSVEEDMEDFSCIKNKCHGCHKGQDKLLCQIMTLVSTYHGTVSQFSSWRNKYRIFK